MVPLLWNRRPWRRTRERERREREDPGSCLGAVLTFLRLPLVGGVPLALTISKEMKWRHFEISGRISKSLAQRQNAWKRCRTRQATGGQNAPQLLETHVPLTQSWAREPWNMGWQRSTRNAMQPAHNGSNAWVFQNRR